MRQSSIQHKEDITTLKYGIIYFDIQWTAHQEKY